MSMGKSWNKLGRKGHRHERAQPESRRYLGYLEHHKDYTKRAKDYHKKQDELDYLRLLASMRNPDEFHSDMVHAKAEDGRLWIDRESKLSKKQIKIIRENDSKYMTMQLQHAQNKLRRELNSFHCLDAANVQAQNGSNDANKAKQKVQANSNSNSNTNTEIVESSNSINVLDARQVATSKNTAEKKADHVIFVDGNKERLQFNACGYFGTPKVLLNNKHNRLRTTQLTNKQIKISAVQAAKLKKQTLLKYWQLQGRMSKVENMKKYQQDLNTKRKIASGDRYLVYKKRNVYTGKVAQKRYKW
eukprot:CAMPEP_0197056364 /NCGR_PEP_ID=MMETSP1384-20130603/83419_1 /TAXON_ID=29189 /ORGANISM="Ammonia sp." /LENGTH=301 /DNA_ID=CAMNT_0042490317 /DNA_START=38 /DNA_END=940 /DNA_ORIENTATION=-